MMIRVYRLVNERGPERDRPFGGTTDSNHWNGEGTKVAYAAESIAVCALEILAQWGEYENLAGYVMFALDLDAADVEDVARTRPDLDPHDRDGTRAFGDAWAREARSLAIRVPSVVVPLGCNFVVNPNHPGFDPAAVREVGDFRFDERIVALIEAAKGRGERAGLPVARARSTDRKRDQGRRDPG